MIAIKPGTDAWRVLELVTDRPGEHDAGSIGVLLWPPSVPAAAPLSWSGPASVALYREWLSTLRGRENCREAHRTAMARVASRILGRLQEAGMVEAPRPPRLSGWWSAFIAEKGRRAGLVALERSEESSFLDESRKLTTEEEASFDAHIGRLLTLVAEVEKMPESTAALIGSEAGGEAGGLRRAYERLVALGVVVPPSYRWPTLAGAEKIRRARVAG